MRLIYSIYFAGLALSLFTSNAGCKTATSRTTLFLQDTLDLGVIITGQKKDAVIAIRNAASQYVRIESIRGDCNCVNINTCPTGLSVDESAKITLTYDSEPDKQFKGVLYKVVLLKASVKPFLQSILLKITIV